MNAIVVYFLSLVACLVCTYFLAIKESKSWCPEYFLIGMTFVVAFVPFFNSFLFTIFILVSIPSIFDMIGEILVCIVSEKGKQDEV